MLSFGGELSLLVTRYSSPNATSPEMFNLRITSELPSPSHKQEPNTAMEPIVATKGKLTQLRWLCLFHFSARCC